MLNMGHQTLVYMEALCRHLVGDESHSGNSEHGRGSWVLGEATWELVSVFEAPQEVFKDYLMGTLQWVKGPV